MANDPIKVYDARWEAHEFDDAAVTRLFEATLAYGRELGVDTIVFSRDARLAAGHVMELGVSEALRQGFRVFVRPEPISTPQGYFSTQWVTRTHPKTMGLGITASHNPSQYVGVKFTVPGVAAVGDSAAGGTVPGVEAIGYDCGPMGGLKRVRELYHSSMRCESRGGATLEMLDLAREYVDYSLATAGVRPGDLRGMTVVLDAFNGSAGPELFRVLTQAGASVAARRLVPDGGFPTGSPNPTSKGKMDAAVALAGEIGAHALLGIDGDGDRMVFGDHRGILTAGFVTVAVLEALKRLGAIEVAGAVPGATPGATPGAGAAPGAGVLYDPKVSPLALAEWGRLGVRPVLFRNGHSQIKDYMKRIGAPAAAEESGHYYHRLTLDGVRVYGENSSVTVLLFLAAVWRDRTLMQRLWELERRIFTTGEFNYQFDSDARRDAALAAVVEHCVRGGASTVTHTPDGIDLEGTCLSRGVVLTPGKVRLEPGWISGYLRVATNEKSVVRSYYTADDAATGKAIEQEARSILAERFGGRVVE